MYIGDNTSIAGQCYVIAMNHGAEKDILINQQKNSIEKIVIGNDCWIAANVTILKESCVEDGAIVGTKSLVKGKIEKNAIAVGCPAGIIKRRK